jgi:K+-sensing histidine kinase KdpD
MEALADRRLAQTRWRLDGTQLPLGPLRAWVETNPTWLLPKSIGAAVVAAATAGLASLIVWSGHGESGLQPYLFWCAVLALATWGGLRTGLLAALAAISMHAVALGLLAHGGAPSPEQLTQGAMVSLLIAVISGEASDRRRRREAHLDEWSQTTRELLRDLEERNDLALEVINELGRRVADQTVTLTTLDTIARRLDVYDQSEILAALLDLLRLCLQAESASVLLLEDGQLQRKAHLATNAEALTSDQLRCDLLVDRALAEGRVCHVREQTGQPSPLLPSVLIAAPLVSPTGAVNGVVAIDQMPLLSLNESAARTLQVIASWAARSLSRAEVVRQLQDPEQRAREMVDQHHQGRRSIRVLREAPIVPEETVA